MTRSPRAGAPPDACALILAGGSGERMGTKRPKQFLEVGDDGNPGHTVLDLLLSEYEAAGGVDDICVVCHRDYEATTRELALRYPKVREVVLGGATRHESVHNGLRSIERALTIIHDAARPVLHRPALEACLQKIGKGAEGIVTTFHPYASMLVTTEGGPVTGVMERDQIAFGMCPVAYYTADLLAAFEEAAEREASFRDEPALMRALRPDLRVETVPGHQSGFKLTYPEDLDILRAYLRHRSV